MGRLRDKVILITGAAGGIGSAIAEAVVRNGGACGRDRSFRPRGVDHPLDVTSEADWQRVMEAVGGSAGRLDGLVNAAGIVVVGTAEDNRLRELAPRHGGQSRRHVPRLQIRNAAVEEGRRLDREHLLGVGAWSAVTISRPTTPRRAA
jgi:NAD(P)-dependent dehydrogenase (short-subunit alcohol dehydrogenase family)